MAEKFAKQPVSDVVITVPVFFNQAERRALVAAAKIAELNLLQVGFDFKRFILLSAFLLAFQDFFLAENHLMINKILLLIMVF